MKADLCPSCFSSGYQNFVCPVCGYQLKTDKNVSARNLPAGTVLNDRYYVGRILGAGGFGITYKAYDMQSKTICCIKEYAPSDLCSRTLDGHSLELLSNENEKPYRAGLKRFTDEANILGGLGSIPSVVKITETFHENNTAYFAMEFLDGADLKKLVQSSQSRLPVKWVVDVILQVALSMDVIHTKTGIIHRDISPENIYITREGKVKLIDFGSAKRTENGLKAGLSVVLKPKYAPPEQFSSEMVQGAFTDVYALASSFYYALTGQNVPSAPDRMAGKEYTPLKKMELGVSDGISDAVDHALLLNVHKRTPTMQQFVVEIVAGMPQSGQENLSAESAQPAGKKRAVPYVVILSGPGSGKRFNLPANRTITVGRSKEANVNLMIDDLDVSRIHCRIAYMEETERFFIQDNSTNGTFYKNFRLMKDVVYQIGAPARFTLAKQAYMIGLGVDYEYH